MKKVFLILFALVFLISGCSFDVHVITPAPADAADATPLASSTPIIFPASETPIAPSDTPVPGFTPDPGVSLFYGAHAVENPTDPVGRSSFPVGIKRIYVVWNYQNMHAGQAIKREWYLDGKLWLMREEPWDYAKYGANGTVQDISIYDDVVGLPTGVYQLHIYIDGLQQPIGAATMFGPELWLNFEVQPAGAFAAVSSPDFKWGATILGERRLIVRDQKGTPLDLYIGTQIPALAWFPDSQHILFIDRKPAGDQLWVVDVLSKETALLVESDTLLGVTTGLTISPDGHFVATTEGNGNGDACFVSLHLLFVEMGATYQGARVFYQKQFSGLTANPDSSIYPTAVGSWQSNTQYVSPIDFTCVTDESLKGEYLFDLSTLIATKK